MGSSTAGTGTAIGTTTAPSNNSTGRERAIEALIDREPQGDFYRAARVVDEAVPIAQGSRPNLVTKAALVDQAFCLSVHDVDSLAKYDLHLLEDGMNSVESRSGDDTKKVDTLTKERIFHYQAKIAAAKLNPKTRSNSTEDPLTAPSRALQTTASVSCACSVSPASNLVAALRHVFEEPTTESSSSSSSVAKLKVETSSSNSSLFELRHLLQAISSHAIFQGSSLVEESSGIAATISSKHTQANLEKLIVNVTKQVSDQKEDREASLQGLLVAILSVLTSQQPHPQPAGLQDDPKKTKMAEAKTSQPKEQEQDDLPFQSVLQVGALLSLLPLEVASAMPVSAKENEGSADAVVDSASATIGRLDPALLEYFGAAAAVYEERWEIQKARMLARMQTPPPPERSHTPPFYLIFSSESSRKLDRDDEDDDEGEQQEQEDNNAETPTAGDHGGPDVDFSETESPSSPAAATVVEIDAEPEVAVNDLAVVSVVNEDEAGNGNINNVEGSSGSESEEDGAISGHEEVDDDDEPYESNSDGVMEDVASGNEDGEHPDQDDDDDAVDESSSSSSSESSDEEGIGDSDGDALDTDDDDEAVLRQALAMSMAEHEEAEVAAEEAASMEPRAIESSTDGVVVPAADDDVQSDEENSVPASEDATPALPSADTPASRSTDGQLSNAGGQEGDDESNLPPFPKPPVAQQFSFLGGTSGAVVTDDPDARASSKLSNPLFDPSELGDFGSIPTSHVLFHLLRFAAKVVELRISIEVKPSIPPSVFAGGIGFPLFSLDRQSQEQTAASASVESSFDIKQDVTLQLLIAAFLLMIEQRNDAIENLRKAIAREQRVARDGNFDSDDDDDRDADDDSSGAPLSSSGEEDDPALTLAMNYVEDDVPLSSDSLENKGMMRKAAAAAHDAALMMKSLRKRTDAWKYQVRLFSTCVACSLKMLRQFLQSVVRQSFAEDTSTRGKGVCLSVLDFHTYLPPFVAAKLSEALDSLTAISTQNSYLAVLGGEEVETERLFLSLSLYREAVGLWGECIPLLYSSDISRSDLLKSSMQGCLNFSIPSQHLPSMDNLAAFPTSDIETQVHKLKALCRRLRIRDLLDGFVSRPIPYLPDDDIESGEGGNSLTLEAQKLSGDPRMASSLVSLLADSISDLAGDRSEAQRLYLALCHRCHARILLLDGFYATTETESDDRPASSSTTKALSTGDSVRVAAGPSSTLQFDATKCSDSIALLSGFGDDSSGATSGTGSVHQRASKVWGTVLSTHQYSPKTGIHRWAVRLDKCERGHVFIGVATTQASTKTYVGGDKYGWGMIGTQALWHDRRKIRGDYGATFRTGSTIIVTLDSDAGTLSFSSWKDGSSSSSFSLDPVVQNIVSPRKSGQVGGTVEDWGVAFEGLPLDAKLYPAVGLYQRDDRVTLLSVEAPGIPGTNGGMTEVSGGECYFPRPGLAFNKLGISDYTSRVRRFNDLLTWDGIRYAAETLQHAVDALRKNDANDFVLRGLLPSLGAALCLLPPSVPILSARCALVLIPHLSRCILELERLLDEHQRTCPLFQNGVVEGKWTIRATASTGTTAGFEEYVVDFKTTRKEDGSMFGIEGSGIGTIGKSKNGLVNILGCVNGSSLSFIENWSGSKNEDSSSSTGEGDASSCVVAARIGIDGKRFEGAYRNVPYGSAGQIVGMLSEEACAIERLEKEEAAKFSSDRNASIGACGVLLCLAQSHLATLLGEDSAGDLEHINKSPVAATKEVLTKQEALKGALTRPLLSNASLGPITSAVEKELASLSHLYRPPTSVDEIVGVRSAHLLTNSNEAIAQLNATRLDAKVIPPRIAEQVAALDDVLAFESGGLGSLRSLCPSMYTEARRQIICSLLFQCRLCEQISESGDPNEFSPVIRDQMRFVWRAALKIMEDGVRRALSRSQDNSRRDRCSEVCQLFSQTSSFLLAMDLGKENACRLAVEDTASEFSFFYNLIDQQSDLEYLKSQMSLASKRGLLRLVSLGEIVRVVRSIDAEKMAPIEALILGLPRQLGRGKAEPTCLWSAADYDQSTESVPDLDGSYLSRLSGSNLKVKDALRKQACSLFESLGRVLEHAISQRSCSCLSLDYISSNDSLVLSIVTIFIGHLRRGDIDDIVSGSRILSILPMVMSAHRYAILRDPEMELIDDDKPLACSALQEICQRDISRAILRCAVAAAHVVTYQGTMDHGDDSTEPVCSAACVNLLLTELAVTFPFIEHVSLSSMGDMVAKRSEDEWQSWNFSRFTEKTAERTGEAGRFRKTSGFTCLRYLREHGTMLNSILQGNLQTQPLSPKGGSGGSSRQASDGHNNFSVVFAHQFLSHWLHVLCAVLRSRSSLSTITLDKRWLTVLLKGVGLTVEYSADGLVDDVKLRTHDDGILPARFRARILRLMLPLLSALEASQVIVGGLLHLAGVASSVVTQSLDKEECFVSRESISLLRQLHSPVHRRWRESINRAIAATTADPGNDSAFFCKKVGVLSFFAGSLETIGRGSYVLLKPSASSALSPDHQSSPSSKTHPNGIGGNALSAPAAGATPHHVVGNGTSSVVAGLCLAEASAGIVSNIDLKNGVCEVILVARGQKVANGRGNASETKQNRSTAPGRSSLGGRHTLTVRALRTPLADVVHAQEVPLFLDESIPFEKLTGSIFQSSLDSLLSAMSLKPAEEVSQSSCGEPKRTSDDTKCEKGTSVKESEESNQSDDLHESKESITEMSKEKNVAVPMEKLDDAMSLRSGVLGLSMDLMTIRCCIVILSDRRMLSSFHGFGSSKKILSKVLAIAWPDDSESGTNVSFVRSTRTKGLPYLPVHEARFGHLVSLLRDLNFRMLVMKQTSGEQQKTRLEYFRSQRKAEASKPLGAKLATAVAERSSNSTGASTTNLGDTQDTARDTESNPGRSISQSTGGSNPGRSISQSTGGSNSDDEEESEAAATATAHLRDAAIAQMAELGLPRSWSELALRRTGGINIEAAVTFCLERGPEIERLLAEEQERDRLTQRDSSGGSSSRRSETRDTGPSNRLLRQLLEMGFPKRWCTEALAVTGNNVDEALTWILNNGERLSEEDEAIEAGGVTDEVNEDDVDSVDDDDEDETEVDDVPSDGEAEGSRDADIRAENAPKDFGSVVVKPCWTGSVIPLRFISGRAIVDPVKMEISGLPAGGFSSVGTKGVLLSAGKWYYEAILETAGCLQIGWADGSFAGHCHADRGDGCGDGPSSWAYDGWRRYRWHATATEWGCRWKEGDVVGCLVDMDERIVSFTLNGQAESIGMGVAFTKEGFRPCGGVYACVSFNRKEKLRLILGGGGSEPFKHQPPCGYRGVGEAVLEAVQERDQLLAKENVLDTEMPAGPCEVNAKRFLCDFSDGDHGYELMAWAHRYYGSDASVHLGSGRPRPGTPKSSSSMTVIDSKQSSYVTRRLQKVWAEHARSDAFANDANYEEIATRIFVGYGEVQKRLTFELFNECLAIAVLLSRKLLLHLLVAEGQDFNPSCLAHDENSRLRSALKFWNIIEACTSLRSVGWVGEAGAMAIAAEALGLGISSNDQLQPRSAGERLGVVCAADLDDGLFLPTGGFTQVLSSVLTMKVDSSAVNTCHLTPSIAEAAMGSDGGGGILAFLQEGLQSAVCRSPELRCVLVAATRRYVRRLAVVEYDSDDFEGSDQKEGNDSGEKPLNAIARGSTKPKTENGEEELTSLPDARLTAFLSGLLLSKPIESSVDDFGQLQRDLVEAWSIGLLSASLPWRMICASTVAGILNQNAEVLPNALKQTPTLARYFGRLQSTVARRLWAERAAVPVCSRYAQALVELLTSVQRSVSVSNDLPTDFSRFWGSIQVDAATPLPLCASIEKSLTPRGQFWESDEGWISSDSGWEVWTGTVEFKPVEWKTPSRSSVHTLMDGGDGPPMLREGCIVMRGVDWDQVGSERSNENDDGKDAYDAAKARRDKEKRLPQEKEQADDTNDNDSGVDAPETGEDEDDAPASAAADPAEENESENPAYSKESPACPTTDPPSSRSQSNAEPPEEKADFSGTKKDKKKKKNPNPKLPIGTVLSVEPWNGIPGMARRVCWNLTGIEGVYRFGGDGGRYDICHVEVNRKGTRVKKRHPLPESSEQCAARHGFGARTTYSVLLRIRRTGEKQIVDDQIEYRHEGVLEWPDFGAGVRVNCTRHGDDGAVTIEETQLLFGSKDSGWVARFGQPSFVPGCVTVLSPTKMSCPEVQAELDVQSSTTSLFDELVGSSSFEVEVLRNPADGSKLKVSSEMRLQRGRQTTDIMTDSLPPVQSPLPPPITFDHEYHAPSLSLSRDGRTVSCVSSDGGRGTAFASMGFTKGVHYWEVKLEQADIGSVYIGVAEKPMGSGSGSSYSYDSPPRLNRWHGWGFVNFRATYTSGAERVFGSHCHAGDTVGVLLDCDAGRVSFFFDGLKYGEHILNDLGCAFENLSPFGFNVDGCGSGGAGQGAPSGFENGPSSRFPAQGTIRPRTLWPVIGLRNQSDRVTLSSKWSTSFGVDGVVSLSNIVAVGELLSTYSEAVHSARPSTEIAFPRWFIEEAFSEYIRWSKASWTRSVTRGSGPYRLTGTGLDVDFDASPTACAAASAILGLGEALLAGDRVRLTRSAGRILELAEEAVVLGAYQGRLYYRIVSQKSEGGSLTEGGGRAWCWDESEVVDGLTFVSPSKGRGVLLPKLARFTCLSQGGLRVIYENGAVLRSDLEIFDGSVTLGTLPVGTIIPKKDVLDRRVNSCGVVRFRVRCEEFGEGWISARIRFGTEELIVEPVNSVDGDETEVDESLSFRTPLECAAAWHTVWQKVSLGVADNDLEILHVENVEHFSSLISQAVIPGLSAVESDAILASATNVISNYSDSGDALESPFQQVAAALSFALTTVGAGDCISIAGASAAANQAVASVFADFEKLPPFQAVVARVALLRSFNRRARLALPFLSIRPCQEGSAIFGGLSGHGTSPDRAGRAQVAVAEESWVQVPSIATKIRSLRSIFFTSVKRDFLQSIVDATTTPTPLSHDEYELPREIRTVRINRLKAERSMLGDDRSSKRKHSVFAQLHSETKNWGGAGLRRGYVAKGHGGQKRAFKVKLIGEGVNDYSGPYREAFTDAIAGVVKTDADGSCPLGVLDPSPNNASSIGENRDLYMFSLNGRQLNPRQVPNHSRTIAENRIRRSFASLMAARDESSREVEESLVFLGRLTGTAFRHGIPLGVPLPLASVWKALTEQPVSSAEKLRELDNLAHRQLENEKEADDAPLVLWQQRMLNAFAEGLGNVIPIEILPLFTGEELRDTMCGNPDVDVDLLKQVVEYEGYSATDKVIEYFWETLNEMTNDERKQFLQFVWARNRLPMREADFDAPFKIQKDTMKTDQALPSASTCFFTLTLPDYGSQALLREKLLFAINNVTTMETDFQTNSAEIAEGYRAL